MACCLLSANAIYEWETSKETVTFNLIVDLSIGIEDLDPQVAAKKKADREA